MSSADLGQPVLLFILIFWAIFAISAVLTSFTKRENLRDMKEFYRKITDTHHHLSEQG